MTLLSKTAGKAVNSRSGPPSVAGRIGDDPSDTTLTIDKFGAAEPNGAHHDNFFSAYLRIIFDGFPHERCDGG